MSFLLVFTILTLCSLGFGYSANTTQGCHMAKLDLVIIVDSSASVTSVNFKKIVKFIQDLVNPLPVHSDGIRVALVRYSKEAHVISYLGDDMNKQEKSAVLGSMKYTPGATRTDLALAMTRNEVLTPARGDRPDVPDQVILLTDGASTNKAATRDEALLLKKLPGLKIIVLGIGDQLDDTELLHIATSPDLKHVVTNFSHLSGMLKDLESATCEDRTKTVTQAPVIEVLTPTETENVIELKNPNTELSIDNILLHNFSFTKESSHPSKPSLTRQYDTTNSIVESYSGDYKCSSDDHIYPSGTLSDVSPPFPGTPSFQLETSESSSALSSLFNKLHDSRPSLFIPEISSQSEVEIQATTTSLRDYLVSAPALVPSELQLSPSKVLSSTPPSSDVSITDPDYDVIIRSFTENRPFSAYKISDFNAVNSADTLTSSIPTPSLSPILLPLLTLRSDELFESTTSFSTFVESTTSSSTFVLSPTTTSTSLPVTPTSDSLTSIVRSSTDDSFTSKSLSDIGILPTFTTKSKESQSRIFNTNTSESVVWTDHSVFVNISTNSPSIETGNSKTGGDISSDFVYVYVGGGIVGLVTLLATSIILARIFRNQKGDGDVAT